MAMTQTMSNTRTEDEAAIHGVLSASYEAWARGDAAAMVADYTEDATAIMTASMRDGRAAIEASMAAAFAGPLQGSRTMNERLGLRWVGRDAAIVVTESGIVFAGADDVPEGGWVHATWMLEKRDGRWLIAAYHNSPVTG
jgi:uncharacterized protein (TIGR02246 family)